MIFTPKKRTLLNVTISLSALLIFAVFVVISKLFNLPDVVWQGAFFVLAIIMCELLTKYFLPIYTYLVDEKSFIIRKTLGKKDVTVCNVDLPRVVALYTKEEYKKQEEYHPVNVYNYNGNIVPASCYVLIFEYSDCTEAVIFESNTEMAELIRASIKSR